MKIAYYRLPLGFVLLVALAGCGRGNALGRQAVTGHVTLKGAPLDHGAIEFAPQQPEGVAAGAVIAEGNYSVDALHGLPPGKYLVRIRAPEAAGQTPGGPPGPGGLPGRERIGPDWNEQSKHEVEVTAGGRNQFDFDVK